MTTAQIIEIAMEKLPYTSEFGHDVIRIPVRNTQQSSIEALLPQTGGETSLHKSFYEVEFKKQYIKNIAIGWEFVNIY